jgi:serine/threonine protein kinase
VVFLLVSILVFQLLELVKASPWLGGMYFKNCFFFLINVKYDSPDYMAPEVLAASAEGYGEEVDWWSLGCVFFDIICGYPPFSDSTPMLVCPLPY